MPRTLLVTQRFYITALSRSHRNALLSPVVAKPDKSNYFYENGVYQMGGIVSFDRCCCPLRTSARLSSSSGSIDAMNKRKSSRITGVFVILFGFMPLLNSLSNPRLASAHGSDRLQLIAVGLCFGIGACLLAGLFRFPGE